MPGRRQSKTPILSRNVDQKSLETEFSIAICRHVATNDNRKHRFYRFLIRVCRLLIAFSIAAYPVWEIADDETEVGSFQGEG